MNDSTCTIAGFPYTLLKLELELAQHHGWATGLDVFCA